MGSTGGPIRKNQRARLAVMAIGILVLTLAGSSCGGDSEAQEPDTGFEQPAKVESIEEVQGLIDFPLWVPADVPAQLEFEYSYVDSFGPEEGTVAMTCRLVEAVRLTGEEASGLDRVGVVVDQDTAPIRIDLEHSSPVEIQGTTGFLRRGEDIGNPGLVAIRWRRDGMTFTAYTFPEERFTEEEFLRFLNSLE